MRRWDLIAGAARLELAFRTLRATWDDVREQWDDAVAVEFEHKVLEPLEPRVRRTLEAIKQMSGILASAERDIEPQ